MGKPSTTSVLKSSNHSLSMRRKSCSKINISMNFKAKKNKRKRSKKLVKDHIIKVFNQLRNDTSTSRSDCTNVTVIDLDDSELCDTSLRNNQSYVNKDHSVIELDNSITPVRDQNKSLSSVKRKRSSSFTNINDNKPIKGNTTPKKKCILPFNCSTPLKNRSIMSDIVSSNVKLKNSCSIINNNTLELNKDLQDLTKEINPDSYLTIDLTDDSGINKTGSTNTTVIDLVNDSYQSNTAINDNQSMSGDSDVTVLNVAQRKKASSKQINKFADGISRLNASDKGRLLELITQKLFNGCNVPNSLKETMCKESRSTDTAQDSYIKEVIVGASVSGNSFGSNIYNPERDVSNKTGLRMIVIDGSNVAMEHGKGRQFSVKGLKICIDYFLKKGHTVKAFVPRFRCKFGKSTEPKLLDDLERKGHVVYTPSREVQGRFIVSYDDRYIVQCAAEFEGVIVSGDNYRDLMLENPKWRPVIANRILPFTWVNDMLMFPKDPLGRNGPSLEQFLRHPPVTTSIRLF